ncbi:MAG: SMC-Scp complex subunit ScpB [Candidatus Hinthialibacter antarcticus]|nr:SMC-Scp complex subunit ScpB [Candidatus Hinthialibacter antarcticus]
MELDNDQLAGILQALIFVSGDPIPVKRLGESLDLPDVRIQEGLEYLNTMLLEKGSGIQLMEVAGGFQLRTRPIYSSYVNRYLERKRTFTLSGAALETLAIAAYKQPITRAEIEAIRGVGADGVLKSLLDKRFLKVTGVREAPGRPNLYGTTKHFLEHFGINSLKDLPPIEYIEKTFSSGAAVEEEAEPTETEIPTTETNQAETEAAAAADPPNAGPAADDDQPKEHPAE